MQTMWAGRFSKQLDHAVNDFNSSIRFDARMYQQDIKGSVAHAQMLAAQGILTQADADRICDGLLGILEELNSGTLEIDPNAEDIHMFVEAELTKRLGDVGKRLHTARSRNDQVAVDIRLYLRHESQEIEKDLIALCEVLCKLGESYADVILPGYTHLQRAQPITFGHHLMAYAMMFLRDLSRIQDAVKRMNFSPLGSCALAGTTHPIDRHHTAKALGFAGPCENSLDGVSDRDFAIEIADALALIMMHLSRFSEEVILWSSWEFKYIELDDAFSTGSSIMPQKKNPDIAELVRGKTGRVYGNLMALLTQMKGLPLAYNKDMQEDKEAIFDSVDTVKLCLPIFTKMLETMQVLPENMLTAAQKGFINATDLADYLVKKGLPFRSAYKMTGELVAYCISHTTVLEALPLEVYQQYSELFDMDLYKAISMETCVATRTSYGGTCPESVRRQVAYVKEVLGKGQVGQ